MSDFLPAIDCGVGIDLGGSHISIVLLNLDNGNVLKKFDEPVVDRGIKSVTDLIIHLILNVINECKNNSTVKLSIKNTGIGNCCHYWYITRSQLTRRFKYRNSWKRRSLHWMHSLFT